MDFSRLQQKLTPQEGVLTIARDTLTTGIQSIIDSCYNNEYNGSQKEITISSASSSVEGGDTVVVRGKAAFLNVPDLPVTGRFSLDDSGNVRMLLVYSLLDADPGANAWKFSRSFTDIPTSVDWHKPMDESAIRVLDELFLFNAYYVVSSQAAENLSQVSDITGVSFADGDSPAVRVGINFVGRLAPRGILSLIETTFQQSGTLTLYGPILLPYVGQKVLPLEPFHYPWQTMDAIPGIHLCANLGVDLGVGKVDFQTILFRVYMPVSTQWLEKNPSHVPLVCYSGGLSIPSAAIHVQVVAEMIVGADSLTLYGSFSGVSVANLARMVDLIGSDAMGRQIPSDLNDQVGGLSRLELMQAGITFSTLKGTPEITYATFTVGFPDLSWHIWKDDFVLDSISCRFEVYNPFDRLTRNYDITIIGRCELEGAPLNVYAGNRDGFTMYAAWDGAKIPLQRIVSKYASGLPVPSDLTIDTLRLAVAPRKYYAMAVFLAGEPNPWTLDLGPETLTISDVSLAFNYPSGGPASGSFGGTIALKEIVTLTFNYDVPGDFLLRSMVPETITLNQILGALTNQAIALPSSFDLKFQESSILIQKHAQNYMLQLGTQIEGLGSVAFQVQKVGQQWGFAAGLDFNVSGAKITGVEGLSALGMFLDFFSLEKFLLVVASFDNPGFQFPDMAQFQNPNIAAKKITLPAQSGGIIAGLNIFAQWQLDTASREQKLLKEFLGLDPALGVTLQVGEDPARDSRLYVSFSTTIEGHPLVCKFGGQIQDGSIGLFLTGTFTVDIQSQPQTFDVTLLFVETGAFISADMRGSSSVHFWVFHLANLALEVGIDWEGIPSLGVAATIDVGRFDSSVAVFFDSAEPQKSLVAGAVSDLNLKDVLDALTGDTIPSEIDDVLDKVALKGIGRFQIPGSLADDLDQRKIGAVSAAFLSEGKITIPAVSSQVLLIVNTKGSLWYLTDMTKMRHYQLKKSGDSIQVSLEPQFYCAPQDTYIASIRFPMGFYLNAAIQFFDFNASAKIDISPNQGIAVDAQMDKIVLGSEFLFAIEADKGSGGPLISASTYSQPDNPVKAFQSPHFCINGKLEMLGMSKGIYADLSLKGFEFDLNGTLIPAVDFDLHGTFGGTELDVGGRLSVGIGTIDLGPLGSINLDTGIEGDLDIGVNAADVHATFGAAFEFLGDTHSIATFDLDIQTRALENLAQTLLHKVGSLLYDDLIKEPLKWAKAVGDGIVEGVEDVESVLKDTFKLGEDEVKKIIKEADRACSMTTAMLHM